jgi:UDP-glucose:(heptosyl)LPS alpha-1,3-glucosyltransferase
MKLAVCLYKLFPFGGLARDCVRILSLCYQQGAQVDVYVMECEGDIPEGFNVTVIDAKGITNHSKVANFRTRVKPHLDAGNYDLVIGFNKMPGLDLYYAADPCYIDKVEKQSNYPVMRFSGRVKFYSNNERQVFGPDSKTVGLMISDIERDKFKHHYDTPDDRLIMLPPGIDPNRKRADDWQPRRQQFRAQFKLNDEDIVILMVGSGFKRKGVDRVIEGLSALPAILRNKTKLFVLGEDDIPAFEKLAKQQGVAEQVTFFGGRSDVPEFLLGTDLFLHPARKENTGTVILEALVAGLPAFVSGACGYAGHITKSEAGLVSAEPFEQQAFNQQLASMLDRERLQHWSDRALHYADTEDLYSMPQKVAAIIETMVQKNKENSH